MFKKYLKKIFGKVKSIKAPAGFELITYRFDINTLTHYATLLGNNLGKEKIYEIRLYFAEIRHNMEVSHITLIIYIALSIGYYIHLHTHKDTPVS